MAFRMTRYVLDATLALKVAVVAFTCVSASAGLSGSRCAVCTLPRAQHVGHAEPHAEPLAILQAPPPTVMELPRCGVAVAAGAGAAVRTHRLTAVRTFSSHPRTRESKGVNDDAKLREPPNCGTRGEALAAADDQADRNGNQ